MAKKKKLSRKEQKRQQQAAKARQRQKRGWSKPDPSPTLSPSHQGVDMDLLGDLGGNLSVLQNPEGIASLYNDSVDLVDEPELVSIFTHPPTTVATFLAMADHLGYDLGGDEDPPESAYGEVLNAIGPELLTDEFISEIIAGLSQLRKRLKRENGSQKEIQKIAFIEIGLQSALDAELDSADLINIGLVSIIIKKSIQAGLVMRFATKKMTESDLDDAEEKAFFDTAISEVPGLSNYLDKYTEDVLENAFDDLAQGELYLQIYTETELREAETLIENHDREDPKEFINFLISWINKHIINPERLKLIANKIEAFIERGIYPGVLTLILMEIEEIPVDPTTYRFLIAALFGEINEFDDATMEQEPDISTPATEDK